MTRSIDGAAGTLMGVRAAGFLMVSDADRTLRDTAPPEPLSDEDAHLEASIRMKLDRGEALDAEERMFLARLPGEKEAGPEVVGHRGKP